MIETSKVNNDNAKLVFDNVVDIIEGVPGMMPPVNTSMDMRGTV